MSLFSRAPWLHGQSLWVNLRWQEFPALTSTRRAPFRMIYMFTYLHLSIRVSGKHSIRNQLQFCKINVSVCVYSARSKIKEDVHTLKLVDIYRKRDHDNFSLVYNFAILFFTMCKCYRNKNIF